MKHFLKKNKKFRQRNFFVIMFLMLLSYYSVTAQVKSISGNVTDTNGEPLPGVTILQKGTQNGVVTDFDGNYSIKLIQGPDILVFSFIGFKTVEKKVGENTVLNVRLSEDNQVLDEVVVVGYGTQAKKDVTGSQARIKTEALLSNNPTNIATGFQGKITGLKVTTSSGDPSAGSTIVIRGASSVTAGTSPLYVIDGVLFNPSQGDVMKSSIGSNNSSNPLDFLNPSDIKSVTVLKDASATAIYGAQGANGVILIETKTGAGTEGKAQISFDMWSGINDVVYTVPVLSGNEFIEYRRDVDPNGYLFFNNLDPTKPRDPYALPQHDWQDEILRTGFGQNYNLALRSNTEKTNYSISLGVLKNEAIVKNNENERYSSRINLSHRFSKKLKVGTNTDLSYFIYKGATQSGGGQSLFNGVVQSLLISKPVELYNPSFDVGGKYISPSSMIDNAFKESATTRLQSNVFLDYSILESLLFHVNFSGMINSSKGSEFYGKETSWGAGTNGYANIQESKSINMYGNARLQYKKRFGSNHKVNVLVAAEFRQNDYEFFKVTTTDFIDESTGVYDISKGGLISNAKSHKNIGRTVSFFGRLYYGFKDRHMFTATFRADGSDKFGPSNRWGYFPSVAYGWLFLKNYDSSFINFGKLRLSYGATGNDRISSYAYVSTLQNTYYNGVLGMGPANMANDELKWETTYQANIGLDLGFFNDNLSMTLDLYKKNTQDMLLNAPAAGRTGFHSQVKNIGSMENKGIEFQFTSKNINKNEFMWTTSFNISHNENTVTDLGPVDFINVNVPGGWITNIGRVQEGHSIGEMYGYVFDGVYQIDDFTWQNGSDPSIPHNQRAYALKPDVVSVNGFNVRPGSHKFKDLNGDGEINLDDDRDFIGRSDAIFFGGLTNTFKFKGFDFSIFVDYSYGNEIFNESRYRLEGAYFPTYMNVTKHFYYNHWTPDNPTNEFGDYGGRNKTAQLTSSYYVEDASFIRLNSVSLGYSFSKEVLDGLSLNALRVYVSGNNLQTWTNYSGYYPEISSSNPLLQGVDHISYPRARTVLLGLNVTF